MSALQISKRQFGVLPDVYVDSILIGERRIFVVRDDRLVGGTKQRALIPYLEHLSKQGFRHFIYTSPFSGFAQVALAHSCYLLGLKCTIRLPHIEYDAFVAESSQFSAEVQSVEEPLVESEGSYHIPVGFDGAIFQNYLLKALSRQWTVLSRSLPRLPENLWLPLGSGSLGACLNQLVPKSIYFQMVDIRVLETYNAKIHELSQRPRTCLHMSRLKFTEPATDLPPVPSNIHYDAKLWEFIKEHSKDGDVWWNVAR